MARKMTKAQKRNLTLITLGVVGVWFLARRNRGGATDGYGDATSAAQWYPSKQWPPTTRYDHRGPGIMPFTPLGPVLTLPGLTQRAHPGLSQTQYMQLYLRKYYGVDPSVYPDVVAAQIGSDPSAVK